VRLAPAIALAVVLAAPAQAAETVGHSAVTAGPVLAGGRVLWAEAPSGRPRVLADRAEVASWPAAHTKDTGRTVAALAASPTSVAAVVETCTTRIDFDAVFLGCAERAFGGAGAFSPFGRPLPARGVRNCAGQRAPVSVAAGHGVIAVAETPVCQGIARDAAASGTASRARSRIVLHRGANRSFIPASEATQLRIAGPYLAYLDGGRAVRYDLVTHRKRRLGRAEAIDVEADGRVALIRGGCVRVGGTRIACGVDGRVAIAGGKALYVKGRRLVLGRRTLARGRFAGFDLAPGRAAWAVGPPAGRQRIVLERL
jgi:hypothetical protein